MTKKERASQGTLLFYTRDSGGKHETTPGEYVLTAKARAAEKGLVFGGTPEIIEAMIRNGASQSGDIYLDYDVKGNLLQRPGLDALLQRIESDPTVSHVFIPRRDRLARPDHAVDGAQLELKIRSLGVTLVFLDRVCEPLNPGKRDQIGDVIMSLVDYDKAGKDRRELAQKILFAQLSLAKAGFSTGGRPPYGFRRWLAKVDGQLVRELGEGERVRMAGHHVVWMPVPDNHPELQTIRRILGMLKSMPASRVAAALTAEGVPTPDSGRTRMDNGVRHATSGAWHGTTISNIARNPLLGAMVGYGRRSMGDQLRFEGSGPRDLTFSDFRSDGKPKVIRNDDSQMLTAPAKFEPLVDAARHEELLKTLDERGGTQRGKARSRDSNRNPLGGRIIDLNCSWPMYRTPKSDSYQYRCGAYTQSHGAICDHNQVDGPTVTNVALDTLRQKLLSPAALEKLQARLHQLASQEQILNSATLGLGKKEADLRLVEQDRAKVERNLALADTPEQYQAVAKVFDELSARQQALEAEVRGLQQERGRGGNVDEEVNAAMAVLDRLPELAAHAHDLAAVTEAFRLVNARVFLAFHAVQLKKRMVNRVRCGSITFGAEHPPVKVYDGPTGRRALQQNMTAMVAVSPGGQNIPPGPYVADGEGKSLGNLNRGDTI